METQSTELLPTLYAGAITLIGGLFVIMYAASRFNTPVTNRSITTWMRYHRAASMCLGVGLVLFALLAPINRFRQPSNTFCRPSPATRSRGFD